MENQAKVTSKITTKVKWEDDEDAHYHDLIGTLYFSELTLDSNGSYIDLKARLMYVADQVVTPIVVPEPWGIYSYAYWVPGNYGHDNNPEYILQDYQRCLGFHRGDWNYQGCIATVILTVKTAGENGCYRINTMILGTDSLWGIESDCGDGYQKEVEADCLEAAKLEAREVLQTIRAMSESEIEELFK